MKKEKNTMADFRTEGLVSMVVYGQQDGCIFSFLVIIIDRTGPDTRGKRGCFCSGKSPLMPLRLGQS